MPVQWGRHVIYSGQPVKQICYLLRRLELSIKILDDEEIESDEHFDVKVRW